MSHLCQCPNLTMNKNGRHARVCERCDFMTNDLKILQTHIKIHRENWLCPYCFYQTGSNFDLQNHVYYKHREQNNSERKIKITLRKYTCPSCSYSTLNSKWFPHHLILCRSKERVDAIRKATACDKCEFKSGNAQMLKLHKRKHWKKLSCPFCTYEPRLNIDLQNHVYNHHRVQNRREKKVRITEPIHKCKRCSYSTLDRNVFAIHIADCRSNKND
ncbi:unnamed protein product [Brassicogethes aeneus]|uniref:C2H2-type domain-containing protein n=1 Tax=Brassicogethes aeneus TaxID=1431903 RepID=A0A9P0FDH1_BRAAE|nr:unnamed protein product [Brassicogethes aeneus]